MWLAVFFGLLDQGFVLYSAKYMDPLKIAGSCGGKAHIMGWAIVAVCFGKRTVPYCFHLVDLLGCDIMWGHRAMSLMGTVLDHGTRKISARHVRFSFAMTHVVEDGKNAGSYRRVLC